MTRSFLSAACIAAVLTFTACGGGGSSGGGGSYSPPGSGPTSPSQPASMPQTATVGSGQAFVSASNQHTLYTFGADKAGVSNCTTASGCTGIWPPYTAPGGTTAPSGTNFGLITRSDGTLQWTYLGFPLYTYSGDSGPDQGNGQGINSFGGIWGVARPQGSTAPPGNPGGCVGYSC